MYAEKMRLELPSNIQIVDAICLFALLSLHTLQCFLPLTNRQTQIPCLCISCIHCIHGIHFAYLHPSHTLHLRDL